MFKEKSFLVIGMGISGQAAVKLLMNKEAKKISILEGNVNAVEEDIRKKLPEGFDGKIIIGSLPEEEISELGIDIAVLSPGVPLDSPDVLKLKDKNVKLWGELELGYKTGAGKLFGITGTNGKTTTTSLVGEILKLNAKTVGNDVFVVGNIGLPYTNYTTEMKEDSITVAEVSSFQLETIEDFKPDVSAVLNITPDHLNRHHTMENYIDAKMSIAKNQGSDGFIVLNYEDEVLREKAKTLKCNVVWFSSKRELKSGFYMRGEDILFKRGENEAEEKLCTIHDMKLLGAHNYENVMAAAAICLYGGIPLDTIREGIREFNAVEHRIEYVDEVKGVKYYNDSKGTNPDAAIKAVEAMVRPTVLIGGGYDKASEYDEWILSFKDTVKYLVLIGATRDKIAECAKKHGFQNVIMAESLEEAVKISADKAEDGWAVLLSPACASWDMFKSYEERGKLFKQYVKELA
ncbi:MAG: UDP-N-acetylmuramoyl-L-alanine--D-glutamate ligase [Lachnospiraceae bacterium]|nr:UDP-N-acetylmuramoyl-L-alanine--D-glutamate ligase [Lachnospiraceae bacterium]